MERFFALVGVVSLCFVGAACSPEQGGFLEETAKVRQPLPSGWAETDIGVIASGCDSDTVHTPDGDPDPEERLGVFEITGCGRGVADSQEDTDADHQDGMHFVYTEVEGDKELIAHVVMSEESPFGFHAGLAIRMQGTEGNEEMAVVSLKFDALNQFFVSWRAAATLGLPTWSDQRDYAGDPDVWLRIQRLSDDFAASWSPDGQHWMPIGTTSGGEFSADSTARFGLLVSSSSASETEEGFATFSDVKLRDVQVAHQSTWVGATAARESTGFVMGSMQGFYADAEGRTYVIGNGEGMSFTVYRNGAPVRQKTPGVITDTGGMGQTEKVIGGDPADPTHIYVPRVHNGSICVAGFVWNGEEDALVQDPVLTAPDAGLTDCPTSLGGRIAGIAAHGDEVYASNFDDNKIHVLDKDTLTENETLTFPVTNPRALASDDAGGLWVIISDSPYPTYHGNYETVTNPAIRRYAKTGQGVFDPTVFQQITDVVNPTAIAIRQVDGGDDLLYVAENGPDQNIRIYTLDGTPALTDTFGETGGTFQTARGQVFSSSNGGWARFYNPNGVGVDADGGIYVASGRRVDVRGFPASGEPWTVFGLADDVLAFDRDSDGQTLYSVRGRFGFDPQNSGAGSEWSFEGVTWDPFPALEIQEDGRKERRSGIPIIRNFDGARFMYVYGGSPDPGVAERWSVGKHFLNIYRFDEDDIAIPAGYLSLETVCDPNGPYWAPNVQACKLDVDCFCNTGRDTDEVVTDGFIVMTLWVDLNGDGVVDPTTEIQKTFDPEALTTEPAGPANAEALAADNPAPRIGSFAGGIEVDSEGDIWFPMGNGSDGRGDIWQLVMTGLDDGVPTYALTWETAWKAHDVTGSAPFSRIRYDRENDVMYVLNGSVVPSGTPEASLSRYDDWLNPSTRSLTYTVTLPNPFDSPELFRFDPNSQDNDNVSYSALDIAGDYVFLTHDQGIVYVRKASDGADVTKLFAGPEVSGQQGYQQVPTGVQAVRRSTGEYLIALNETSTRGFAHVFRWTPTECTSDEDCASGEFCDNGTCEERPCSIDGTFGSVSSVFSNSTTASGFALSQDGLTAYVSHKASTQYDIYVATRSSTSAQFDSIDLLDNVNHATQDDRSPWLSPNGLTLYFWRQGSDIYVATRTSTSSSFGTATAVTALNSGQADEDPFFNFAGNQVYFVSDRPGGDRNFYTAFVSGSGFTTPTKLDDISTYTEEHHPVITRNELRMYLGSEADGFEGDTNGDIWISDRESTTEEFDGLTNLTALNTQSREDPLLLSNDECTLYFMSNRDTGGGGTQSWRIYQVTRGSSP